MKLMLSLSILLSHLWYRSYACELLKTFRKAARRGCEPRRLVCFWTAYQKMKTGAEEEKKRWLREWRPLMKRLEPCSRPGEERA